MNTASEIQTTSWTISRSTQTAGSQGVSTAATIQEPCWTSVHLVGMCPAPANIWGRPPGAGHLLAPPPTLRPQSRVAFALHRAP